MKNNINVNNNKLPPNIKTNKPSIKLAKILVMYLVIIMSIQIRVNELMIKTYNGFLKTPLSPAINFIFYPRINFA
jgi:hypothetical protein